MPQVFVTEPAVDDRLLATYQPLFRQNARDIRASWQRCRSAGLGCCDRPPPRRVPATRLARIYAATSDVRALALAEMRLLHGHLGARGFTLTLADPDSVILDCLPGTAMTAAEAADLAPGNCWPEATRGTNAVGTAAAAGRMVVVAGEDHYLETYRGLICIATPVFGADGEVRAIIDATADQSIGSHTLAYTLGLMQMAGDHVQTELFRRRHTGAYVILLDAGQAAGGPSAIALAFDAGGVLRATSAGARTVFPHALMAPGTGFAALFDADFTRITTSIRPPAGFTTLSDQSGRQFQATVYLPERTSALDRPSADAGQAQSSETDAYVAEDASVRAAFDLATRAINYDVPILIEGETGSGKEQLARHIHAASGRAGEFVAINCAGLPGELIEAELFGHAPGAFTGARAGGARGLVRRAHGGTLFLDEIGDMPIALQAHLLRLIDRWEVRPVGAEHDVAVDVQLVTATHRDLDRAAEEGVFRRDLLHRIRVGHVRLPPLRERCDIGAIATALLARIDPGRRLDASAVAELDRYQWPGNIRELRNVLTRLLLDTSSRVIGAAEIRAFSSGFSAARPVAMRQRRKVSGDAVRAAVAAENGNIAAAARRLRVSRTTVYKYLGPPF